MTQVKSYSGLHSCRILLFVILLLHSLQLKLTVEHVGLLHVELRLGLGVES